MVRAIRSRRERIRSHTDRASRVEGESRVGKYLSNEEGKDGEDCDHGTHVWGNEVDLCGRHWVVVFKGVQRRVIRL